VEWIKTFIDICLHLDRYLNQFAASMGGYLYALLFLIIFAETAFVITPFLPGDSLLFAVGVLASTPGSPINLPLTILLLSVAAILGDALNYSIGYKLGPKVFSRDNSRLLNKKHLIYAHEFYEKYGGKTIILARFIPIIRTFAPFVAGIAKMTYPKFALYNITGGIAWVLLLTLAGHYFGQVPFVKKHFEIVILAIIIISVLPAVYEFYRAHRKAKRNPTPTPSVPSSTSQDP
jgi:membrane-associated protein